MTTIEKPEPKKHVHKMPRGECKFCDAHGDNDMMPSHDASPRCESGKRNHCTCDTCF